MRGLLLTITILSGSLLLDLGQTINLQNIRLYGLIDSGDSGGGNQNQGGGSSYDPIQPCRRPGTFYCN